MVLDEVYSKSKVGGGGEEMSTGGRAIVQVVTRSSSFDVI